MKKPFLLIVLGTLILSTLALNLSQINDKIQASIAEFIDNRCKSNITTGSYYDPSFFKHYNSPVFSLPQNREHLCSNSPKLIQNMKNLVEKVELCFHPHELYLKRFMYESFSSFMEFICDIEGKAVNTFYSVQGSDCRLALNNNEAGPRIVWCLNNLLDLMHGIVKEKYLCKGLNEARKCFGYTIQTHCYGFVAFNDLNNDFFASISKPCGETPKIRAFNVLLLVPILNFAL